MLLQRDLATSVIDFGALPPEINSTRMWMGIGSGPLAASGMAWQALAAELGSAAAAYGEVVAALTTGPWVGPSSLSMAAAAAPFVAWLVEHTAQCEQGAISALQAAGVFEAARAGHVHPAVIEENRAELATLVATNFLGVNSPAIAANEALYSEYWAQDAAAMYGYAGDAAGITAGLAGSPFLPPVPTTDPASMAGAAMPAGVPGQAGSQVGGAMGQMGGMSSAMGSLSSLMSAPMQAVSAIPQALQSLTSPLSSLMQPLMGMMSGLGAGSSLAAGPLGGTLAGSLGSPTMSGGGFSAAASMGQSGSLPSGRLSVPPSWGETARPSRTVVVGENGVAPAETADGVYAAPRGGMVPPMAGMAGDQAGSATYAAPMGSLGYRGSARPRGLPPLPRALPEKVF